MTLTLLIFIHGLYRNSYAGPHYFRIPYRTPNSLISFTDCIENFTGNKNLYVMMLPKFCVLNAVIRPEATFNFSNSNQWAPTDIIYSLTLI